MSIALAPDSIPPHLMKYFQRPKPCGRCFLCHLREIFAGVWRVLRRDGVCVIEIGDSYSGNNGYRPNAPSNLAGSLQSRRNGDGGEARRNAVASRVAPELGSKNLILVPQRLALALQADGWTVRSVAPWLRRAAMPESVTDRPSSALSWVIMLAKGPRYWWDAEAVRRPHLEPWRSGSNDNAGVGFHGGDLTGQTRWAAPRLYNPAGRSFRNTDPFYDSLDLAIEQAAADLARLKALRASGGVLTDCDGVPMAQDVNPEPSRLEHFAAWPSRLIRPWILAACPERVCAACGKGWVREREELVSWRENAETRPQAYGPGSGNRTIRSSNGGHSRSTYRDLGFAPACTHCVICDELALDPKEVHFAAQRPGAKEGISPTVAEEKTGGRRRVSREGADPEADDPQDMQAMRRELPGEIRGDGLLQSDMFGQGDVGIGPSEPDAPSEADGYELSDGTATWTSNGGQGRRSLRASHGDVGSHRTAALANRARSPQERGRNGQSDREPGNHPAGGTCAKAYDQTAQSVDHPFTPYDTAPGTVLDPFSGSGTTLLTANRLGRRGIGIDLSAEYADMARRRLERDAPMMNAIQEAEREPARQGALWEVVG